MTPSRGLTLFRLTRFPAVFTSLADIFAGFLLIHGSFEPFPQFLLLCFASAGLYLSGMVFNDVFDVEQDLKERPHRPIPSGAISRKQAALIGSLLMGGGVLAAGLAHQNSLLIALMTAISVLAYDAVLKKTPLAPLGMGACRFFNFLLGASSGVNELSMLWQGPQLWVAMCMGIYITGVTWFARTEARESSRFSLMGAWFVFNNGLLLLAFWYSGNAQQMGYPLGIGAGSEHAVFLWCVITVIINRRALRAVGDPIPANVQRAIGVMLMSVITINASVVYYWLGEPGIPYAIAVLGLTVPAIVLRRVVPMT